MIQLTHEEVQRLIEALYADPLYADWDGAVSLLREKLAELAPKPMTDSEIDDALSDIWGSDTGEVLSAHLQRKIARAIEAHLNV